MAVFTSDQFRPFLPDDRQVNPNVLGFELADWLCRALAEDRVFTTYPADEDWGWYLVFNDEGVEYQICCSGSLEERDQYEWRIFVEPVKRLLRRRPPPEMADELFESALDCLRQAGIDYTVVNE